MGYTCPQADALLVNPAAYGAAECADAFQLPIHQVREKCGHKSCERHEGPQAATGLLG